MTMKLSEAIRLGAMLKPQAVGEMSNAEGTCALGAAHEAAGIRLRQFQIGVSDAAYQRWPVLRVKVTNPDPRYERRRVSVALTIQILNDEERWTREQIADWVATVEAAQETDQPASVVAVARTVDEGKELPRA